MTVTFEGFPRTLDRSALRPGRWFAAAEGMKALICLVTDVEDGTDLVAVTFSPTGVEQIEVGVNTLSGLGGPFGTIEDEIESRVGSVDGLGLLPAHVRFATDKTLARPMGTALGEAVHGYAIHHGVVTVDGGGEFLDGCEDGAVRGTTWHGIFDNDAFRRAFLRDLAGRTGRDFVVAPDVRLAAVRERRYELLADGS